MMYKGEVVNLMNFQEKFKGFSPELIDEVVTSIVYNVEIGSFVEKFGDKPELIKQIKWGILENLPVRYFAVGNADVLRELRSAYKAGLRLDSRKLDELMVLKPSMGVLYVKWLAQGVDLSGYRVTFLNQTTAENMTPFLLKGEDMRKFCTGQTYSVVFMSSVVRLETMGVPVKKLLVGVWTDSVVSFIASKNNVEVDTSLLDVINPRVKERVVRALWDVLSLGVKPEKLIERIDTISSERLELVSRAVRSGLDWTEFDDPLTRVDHLKNLLNVRIQQAKSKKITL